MKQPREQSESRKAFIRVLRIIGKESAQISMAAGRGAILVEGQDGPRCVVPAALLESMVRRGLLRREGEQVFATAPGRELALGPKVAGEGYDTQHREIETCQIEFSGQPEVANINMAESPLASLARRKDRSGRPFL